MEFFDVVASRRSVRKYTDEAVPDDVIDKALEAALLAPNSSNLQTWEFYWVRSDSKRDALIQACLNQNAARTSQHLIAVVANPASWKRHNNALIEHFKAVGSPPIVFKYYQKLIPFLYGWQIFGPIKRLMFHAVGLFRPMSRGPASKRDISVVSIKSAALAAENFMLAIRAQGFDTCPMEGFDAVRVKNILGLGCWAKVVMVISVGRQDPKGIWGERFRVPRDWVVKSI